MTELTCYEKAAVLLLDSLPVEKMTPAKSAALRAAEAGRMLFEMLDGRKVSGLDPREAEDMASKLRDRIMRLFRKTIAGAEDLMAGALSSREMLESVQSLASFETPLKEGEDVPMSYRISVPVYSAICIEVRRKGLTRGEMDEDTLIMIWLLREAGALYDVFGGDEQVWLRTNAEEFCRNSGSLDILWNTEFRKESEFQDSEYLMEGCSVVFPFMERRSSIFLLSDIVGADPADRRDNLMRMLRESGHDAEIIRWQGQMMTRVDNQFYRVLPNSRRYGLVPREGLRMLPVYFKFDE